MPTQGSSTPTCMMGESLEKLSLSVRMLGRARDLIWGKACHSLGGCYFYYLINRIFSSILVEGKSPQISLTTKYSNYHKYGPFFNIIISCYFFPGRERIAEKLYNNVTAMEFLV